MNETIISYKIRIYPSKNQKRIIQRTCGACRWIYNDYLRTNIERYKSGKDFLSGYEYSKKLTKWKKDNPDYMWLNDSEISSKAIHEAFMDADEAYKKFFKKLRWFPRFKSRKHNPINSYFFIGEHIKFKHNKVKLPILGNVKISENGYVPTNRHIIGGTISFKNGKYYASFRIKYSDDEICKPYNHYTSGLGIDVGIKTYLTCANKYEDIYTFEKFLDHPVLKKYEDKINKLQKILSNKMEVNYNRLLNQYFDEHQDLPPENIKNIMKGKSYSNSCIRLQNKISKLKEKQHNYKKNIIDKYVMSLTRLKPAFITIEDLSVKNLLENDASKQLHRHIQDSMFRYFFSKLKFKCHIYGIELRQAAKFFASSKLCHICHHKKKDLKLSDRVYVCDNCKNEFDRDENSAINLVHLKKYIIL